MKNILICLSLFFSVSAFSQVEMKDLQFGISDVQNPTPDTGDGKALVVVTDLRWSPESGKFLRTFKAFNLTLKAGVNSSLDQLTEAQVRIEPVVNFGSNSPNTSYEQRILTFDYQRDVYLGVDHLVRVSLLGFSGEGKIDPTQNLQPYFKAAVDVITYTYFKEKNYESNT